MTFDDYLLHLFCLIDTEYEALGLGRLRTRGPEPRLHDSEVLTMELAGEFLGIDTDKGIYAFFRRHHLKEFPALARVDRTTFARQAASLWRVEQLLHRRLAGRLPTRDEVTGEPLWLVDSFPLHVCKFARAKGPSCSRARPRSATTTSSATRTSGSASTSAAPTGGRSRRSS